MSIAQQVQIEDLEQRLEAVENVISLWHDRVQVLEAIVRANKTLSLPEKRKANG